MRINACLMEMSQYLGFTNGSMEKADLISSPILSGAKALLKHRLRWSLSVKNLSGSWDRSRGWSAIPVRHLSKVRSRSHTRALESKHDWPTTFIRALQAAACSRSIAPRRWSMNAI